MKYESSSHASRPDWTYSVQPPQILSPLWVLERLSMLSIPLAGLGLLAAANYLGLFSLQ
jgi:hypothetical protein